MVLQLWFLIMSFGCRRGRYEVDGYVYSATEEPKILMTGKWNESMHYQPCDVEGEPLPGTELKEVSFINLSSHADFLLVIECLYYVPIV